jgi:zinc protease
MRRFALLLPLLLITAVRGEEPTKVATVEGVTEYRLANGARVLLYPEPSRPTITVNMTVLTGSRHEGYGESGMAHLLEHMVFKGTPTFPHVPKALQDHGAQFNGTTNVDRTNYFETLPATDANLDFAIHLEADRLVNSYVKREDLMSEFTVVRNEFERGENNPQGVLMQRMHGVAYEWHNYGKSTIGNRSDIERVPIDNLQAFYRKYYQPDNVVLIVAGKFDEKKALDLVQKYLGSIPQPKRKLDKTYTEEPAQDGERLVVLRRVGTVGSVAVAYHMPAASHPDWAPLSLLGNILSSQPEGRLYKALVEAKLASSTFGGAGNNHDPGLFTVSATAEPGKIEPLRDALLGVIENLGSKPFTAQEVERAKVRSKRADEQRRENANAMAQALSSASSLGDWRLLFIQRDRSAAVTPDDVNRVAGTYFKKHNRTVGMYIPVEQPERLQIAAAPNIEGLVKDYKGHEVASAAGEAFDPSPANLEARTKTSELGNLKVGMLEKKNRGETVSLVLTLHYGNEESLKGMTTAAGMMPGLMMAGTKKHDRAALRDEMESLGVRISPGMGGFGGRGGGGRRAGGGGFGAGNPGQVTFSIEAKRESLLKAIELLGEILREPAFPSNDFENTKRMMRSGLVASQTEPQSLATNKLSRMLSGYDKEDIRYVPSTEETLARIEAVTLDQVRSIYEKQLGAQKGELAIVGDFDPDATIKAVGEILNDWKSDVPYRRIARTGPPDRPGAKEDILTPDKANAVFHAGLAFPLTEGDPDFPALRLGNFMLGGGTLSSRLGNRIRQKEGLSYGVTSQVTVAPRDPDARFTINAITNPENIDKVEVAATEELRRFIEDGPTEQELSEAKQAYLEAQKVGRTSDAGIAGQIVQNLDLGRGFGHASELEKKIAALTPEDVKAAWKKHVDPKKLVIIRAGDFGKK